MKYIIVNKTVCNKHRPYTQIVPTFTFQSLFFFFFFHEEISNNFSEAYIVFYLNGIAQSMNASKYLSTFILELSTLCPRSDSRSTINKEKREVIE